VSLGQTGVVVLPAWDPQGMPQGVYCHGPVMMYFPEAENGLNGATAPALTIFLTETALF
jgi:hypothetical protein